MSDNITKVKIGEREIILLGTAHVSEESVNEVEDSIRNEKPDRVCIEIDKSRYTSLTNKSMWKDMSIPQVLKEKKGFLLLANLVLSSFQKRLGIDLGVKPGAEMMKAIDISEELGIPFSFCDREIQTTLKRAWSKTGFWGKNKMLAAMISSVFVKEKLSKEEIEKLKEKNALENMMEELAQYMPQVKSVLIDERDRFLATKIFTSEGKKIIAVVGAGHVKGIITWLNNLHEGKASTDLSDIDVVQKKSFISQTIPFILPVIIVSIIILRFLFGGVKGGVDMLTTWILINGTLSAIGAIIAFAHPITIIIAFVAAPITSLIPVLGVGLFTGLVEYKFRKPHVADFENISEDLTSFKGFYRNRFIHILLVFFFSNLGSTIGTFVAGVPIIADSVRNLFDFIMNLF
ncbi:MAG: TraB/GumN family protein [Spirochaetales bacterium]|nr:TraB/GumN family protein [Spirochaetales bacterium]